MSYNLIADMAESYELRRRITSAATQETPGRDPQAWAAAHMWRLAASPGWADAWASAVAGDVEQPGRDEGVITDAMILAAVQALAAAEQQPA